MTLVVYLLRSQIVVYTSHYGYLTVTILWSGFRTTTNWTIFISHCTRSLMINWPQSHNHKRFHINDLNGQCDDTVAYLPYVV